MQTGVAAQDAQLVAELAISALILMVAASWAAQRIAAWRLNRAKEAYVRELRK
jgi:hypothetical protein